MKTLLIAAIASIALSAPAHADTPATATLATPLAKPLELVADGRPWRCDGAACTGSVVDRRPRSAARVCADIVRAAGAVAAFTVDATPVAAETLAKCAAQ
ncbi:CC_3452 family protein [Sandaracinobacteroides saxicola]|uniref:Uncharacterized protein n=1 Tax=Sandaracinobacteroides saxicola TaxID=2759707 RepID=A0A7G5IGT1_9SPHN|nr:hypothetical protein [Sandaracinobacteroides saxicola]QMW22573.1 hypothetical protein H3309_14840 [Sandaracinobacteroides saxicola]